MRISPLISLPVLFLSVFMLSGCVPQQAEKTFRIIDLKGGVIRSEDKGTTYTPRVKAQKNKSISGVDVLWLAMDQTKSDTVYMGTRENGMFITENGGDEWIYMQTPFVKVYGIEIDPRDTNILYATGVERERGRIFKSLDGGKTWEGVYSEPANGTVVISLDISRHDPDILYAGTSGGTIIKTEDGGQSWENMFIANAPVWEIAVDPFDAATVYANIFERTLLLSRDYGKSFVDTREEAKRVWEEKRKTCQKNDAENDSCNTAQVPVGNIFSFTLDLNTPGLGYTGTDKGLFRFRAYGQEWEEVNTIASSREFPIRVVTVNPYHSNEIFYTSAKAIYRSLDNGVNWYTFKIEAEATPSIILHDWNNPENLYVGLRPAK